jgi:hypothetical protein
MSFEAGDRVRVTTVGDDGLPVVRYGTVGGVTGTNGPIVVMLDGELGGDVLDLSEVELVSITSLELRLDGDDLIDDAALRRGLTALWCAEADAAGLSLESLHHLSPEAGGVRDSPDSWVLAELVTGGEHYVLRAARQPNEPGAVCVRADRPNRWDWIS